MSEQNSSDDDFPASKLARSKIFAKTGLEVGKNYARYLADRVTGRGGDADERRRALNTENAEDLFREFTRLRGTALKLAQSMSLDTGMLPDEFMEVMAEAQYSVPPMNKALVRKRIRDALGKMPEMIFDAFETEAIAAASIGQVHRARLPDGRDVAVKVQYPNVRETVESDLAVARTLFRRLVGGGDIDAHFEEVKARLQEETDYLNEADNVDFFAEEYGDHEGLVTPRAVRDYTTETVLTMTYVEGRHLDAFLDAEPDQATRDHFGQLLWDFLHEQVASNKRTLHADAHPGNFLFRDDGTLGVIDFGCVKRFPQAFRDDMLRLYRARMAHDDAAIDRLLRSLDIIHDGLSDRTREQIRAFFDRYGSLIVEPYREPTFDFGDPAFRERLHDCFREASDLREVVGSPHFIFLNKALVGLLNLMTQLKPRIDTIRSLQLLNDELDALGVGPVSPSAAPNQDRGPTE
jgi:predicted unusual protein kinase regulating ubiquinone biosynthesis (AarF/ABC1/UbiB family)